MYVTQISYFTDPSTEIKTALTEFIKTGIKTTKLTDSVKKLKTILDVEYRHSQSCETCKYVVDGVLQYRRSGMEKNQMSKLLEELCMIFTGWNDVGCKGRVANEVVCIIFDCNKSNTKNILC